MQHHPMILLFARLLRWNHWRELEGNNAMRTGASRMLVMHAAKDLGSN